jgi:hypothetical protein
LADIWKPEYKDLAPASWPQHLQQKWVPELGGRCGEIYQRVVLDLLTRLDDGALSMRDNHRAPMTNFELVRSLESLNVWNAHLRTLYCFGGGY